MQQEWYFVRDGNRVGPLTAQELKGLADSYQLAPTDLVSKKGLGKWVPASTVKGLFNISSVVASTSAAAEDSWSFAQGDVSLTSQTLRVGPNVFDLHDVEIVVVKRHINGLVGAAIALSMSLLLLSMSALGIFLGAMMGFRVDIGILSIMILPLLVGLVLLVPASTIWNPKKKEFHLVINTKSGRHLVSTSSKRDEVESLAAKINAVVEKRSKNSA